LLASQQQPIAFGIVPAQQGPIARLWMAVPPHLGFWHDGCSWFVAADAVRTGCNFAGTIKIN
jgi:hypothetical protein